MSKKYIVILRALGILDNTEIENILKNNLYNIITLPILKAETIYSKPINLNKSQAVLTTSSNAIKIFSQLSKKRNIPLYTVGSTSKIIAKRLGYKNVIDCQGDSVKMYNTVLKNCNKTCLDGIRYILIRININF